MTAINWTNITDWSQIPATANTATNGNFWPAMLFLVWIVVFIFLIYWGWEIALLVSSFGIFVIGLLFVYAGLVSWAFVVTFFGIILFLFLYIGYMTRKAT